MVPPADPHILAGHRNGFLEWLAGGTTVFSKGHVFEETLAVNISSSNQHSAALAKREISICFVLCTSFIWVCIAFGVPIEETRTHFIC